MSDKWNRLVKDADGKRIVPPPEGRGVIECQLEECGRPVADHDRWWEPCPLWVDRMFTLAPQEHSPLSATLAANMRKWEEA